MKTVAEPHVVGRYAIFDELASGGMATVHIGRLLGPVGFSRTVAVKRLHPQFAKDPEFVTMFVDEARLAARIRHPNVVPTLDVVKTDEELFLVLDYVQGESLSRLLRHARRRGVGLPIRLVVAVVAGVLHGLHAAHTAKDERGEPLHIVHRDVSPQNILVGSDGVARVFDFGIAKARGRLQTTREGQIKGKLAYMAPEQLAGEPTGPASDVYSAAVVLWETLAGRRLFDGDHEATVFGQVLSGAREPPSVLNPEVPPELDAIVMDGLHLDPAKRHASARVMAAKLERAIVAASTTEVGEWVDEVATVTLQRRAQRVAEIESGSDIQAPGRDAIPYSERTSWPASADGASSQLSTISVARTTSRRPRSLGLPLLIGVALLVVGGIALVGLLGAPDQDSDPRPAASIAAGEVPSPSATAPASAAVGIAAPSASAPASASASASASAPPMPRPVRPAPLRPAPVRPAAPPPPPPPSQCNPPYVVDADGIRHPKPECL